MKRRSLLRLGAAAAAAPLAVPGQGRAQQQVLTIATGGAFTSLDPHYHRLTPNNLIADHIFDLLIAMNGNFQP